MPMKNALEKWLDIQFPEVSPKAFYRSIFPSGSLEQKGEYQTGKYTGIIVAIGNHGCVSGKRRIYRYNITDDLDAIDTAVASDDFCLCSPLSYAGKRRTAEDARMLYAIVIDLDNVRVASGRPIGLENLWLKHIEEVKRIPRPTYIVSSGNGLHLYYVLQNPLPLFRNIAYQLQEYKRELTKLIWHGTIVDIKTSLEIQQEGIYQGFRMPGTVTKNGGRAKAFLTGTKVTLEYLNGFVSPIFRVVVSEWINGNRKMSLEEAKEKYPEWYEKCVVQGEKGCAWPVNRRLYEWWRARIYDEATVGHRYYCMMMLAIYAKKCSHSDAKHNPNPVTREELEKDCEKLKVHMESLTVSDDNHFGDDDVLDALEAFDERWVTYPRKMIMYKTGIFIAENKRNGQKQKDHLEEARAIRDIRCKRHGGKWTDHAGRKSKRAIVEAWRIDHPNGKKADCIRDTGLAKMTVYKHWEILE